VKCSGILSNKVYSIIRRYTDNMNFAAYMAFPFIIFLHVLLVIFFIVYMVVGLVHFCFIL